MAVTFNLNEEDQIILGNLACFTITQTFANKSVELAPIDEGILQENLGSLNKNGRLRGCIGTMIGQEPLYINVARMAHAAAFQDSRFPPLTQDEWPSIEISISVLGPLSPCPDINQINIGQHGLMLRLGNKSGVFLPKVPVEQGWDLNAYLANLCHKAGLSPDSLHNPDAKLFWYETLAFDVTKPNPTAQQ